MQNCHFINFDITVRGTSAPYSIMAHFAGSVAEGALDLESTAPDWQAVIDQLGDPNHAPGNQLIIEAGSALYRTLISGDVQPLWSRARASLNDPDVSGLRLRLALYPPTVAGLPWECLYDPDRRELFAASGRTPLVRIENQERYLSAPRLLQADLPIKVLVACPDDPSGVIDAVQAHQTLDLLNSFGDEYVCAEVMTGRFGLIELSRRLDETQADILHIITHGEPEGLLLWQDETPGFMPAHTVRVALERSAHLKFVLLNACLTGQSSDRTPFAAVGPQMLQTGIPAVIAMQFEIENNAAHDFSIFLYEELLAGPCPGAIDVATGFARSNLYLRYPDRFTFGTPVLWMNAHDGQVFNLSAVDRERLSFIDPAVRRDMPLPAEPVATGGVDEPSVPVDTMSIDFQACAQWLSQRQADVEQREHGETYRLMRFEWQRKTGELAALLELPDARTASTRIPQLQRQINALTDAICSDGTAGAPHAPDDGT